MAEQQVDIDAVRQRAGAATEGPWSHGGRGIATHYWDGRDERIIALTDVESDKAFREDPSRWQEAMRQDRLNGEFMAHARTDIPALLGELDRLRAQHAAALAETSKRAEQDHEDMFGAGWDAAMALIRTRLTTARALGVEDAT